MHAVANTVPALKFPCVGLSTNIVQFRDAYVRFGYDVGKCGTPRSTLGTVTIIPHNTVTGRKEWGRVPKVESHR
ncbi:hypothetical protein BaRGS_00015397 [Batillaria attramentaria]|uniref:Uncharacterized protein n=1 Tax=Batillaria attramentaria TaxID=370345 RepID=A0ABD0L1A9_9CAEN